MSASEQVERLRQEIEQWEATAALEGELAAAKESGDLDRLRAAKVAVRDARFAARGGTHEEGATVAPAPAQGTASTLGPAAPQEG